MYLKTGAGVGSIALQVHQCGRGRLSRGPVQHGTNGRNLFLLSKSREIIGKHFFPFSGSYASVQPFPGSCLDCSRNWYTRHNIQIYELHVHVALKQDACSPLEAYVLQFGNFSLTVCRGICTALSTNTSKKMHLQPKENLLVHPGILTFFKI